MLHICKIKNSPLVFLVEGQPFESVGKICYCGEIIYIPTRYSKVMKRLHLLALLLSIVLLGLIYMLYTKKSNSAEPLNTDEVSVTLTQDKNEEQFDNDPTVKRNTYGTYFLNQVAFEAAAKKQKRKVKTFDDYRDVLVRYLVTESPLIKNKFKTDTAALWKYISDNNSNKIEGAIADLGQSKYVDEIKIPALQVYNEGDEILSTEKNTESSSENNLEKSKKKETPKLSSEYMAGGKFLLKIKNQTINNDTTKFSYSVPGNSIYDKQGILYPNGVLKMDALKVGKGKLSSNSDGTTCVNFENFNTTFKSTK
jgi:hypothetical protein